MKILAVCLAISVILIGFLSWQLSKTKPTAAIETQDVVTRVTPAARAPEAAKIETVQRDKTVQVIKATYDENGISPKRFFVKAEQPVRLEVRALEDGWGCMGSITIPELTDDIQGFEKGVTNVFNFTPPARGRYLITCAMGIPHGAIIAE